MDDLHVRDPRVLLAIQFLLNAQNPDGGWGGNKALPSTIEESSLAVSALVGWRSIPAVASALDRATGYLIEHISVTGLDKPAPIGLYFASLWYSEQLYPLIWAMEALGRLKGSHKTTEAQRHGGQLAAERDLTNPTLKKLF